MWWLIDIHLPLVTCKRLWTCHDKALPGWCHIYSAAGWAGWASPFQELGPLNVPTWLAAAQLTESPTSPGGPANRSFSKTEPGLLPCVPHPIPSIKLQMNSLPVEVHSFEDSRNATQNATPPISFSPSSCKMCLRLVCNNTSTLIFLVYMCTRSLLSSFSG